MRADQPPARVVASLFDRENLYLIRATPPNDEVSKCVQISMNGKFHSSERRILQAGKYRIKREVW